MSINTEHAADWNTQREALSGYLDGRLSPEDGALLRQHLETCSRCAEELSALRQLVVVLRALPPPALPRSFTVSTDELAASGPVSRRTRPTPPTPMWPRVAQWAGGLVAAAGLLVGVAGTVGHLPAPALQGATTAASGASAPQRGEHLPSTAAPYSGDHQTTPAHAVDGGTPTTATPATQPAPTATPTTPVGRSTGEHASPEPDLPTLPIAGATLLVVGATTFAAGTRYRRRQR